MAYSIYTSNPNFMKKILTISLVFYLHTAWATNYYFSSVSGNDSRTPAEAQNPSTPWKSLDKLNSFFKKLRPGDAVLLKRGETFYGSITITKSGAAGSPIVVGAYGSGDRPVIAGLVPLTKWTSTGNGIYESYNSSLPGELSMLLLNDNPQPVGRYPNQGYLTFESHAGKKSITDNELSSSTNWQGAELVIRQSHWKLDKYLIKSQSAKTLYYSGTSSPKDNFGYFIQNNVKTLDQLGEW